MSSDINVQTFSGKVNISNNLKVGSGHLFVDTLNNQVGLNTNDPQANLHVNGNTYVHTNFRVGPSIVMNETSGRITAGSFVGDGSGLDHILNNISVGATATSGTSVGVTVTDKPSGAGVDLGFTIPVGADGAAGHTISSVSASTGAVGVTMSGTTAKSLAFTIPQGDTGPVGAAGHTISSVTASTGAVGVTMSGTTAKTLAFTIPAGADGATGAGLNSSGVLDISKNGEVAKFQPATSGSHTLVNFNSKVNSGSDRGFILVQDETANSPGSSSEDLRMTIGVYNDFLQSTSHSDELWFQGGGRLCYNVGSWDSELNTIIGTPGAGTSHGGVKHEWRINNSVKMTINSSGNVGIGTSSPYAKLHIVGGAGALANEARRYFTIGTALNNDTGTWSNMSIYASSHITTLGYFMSHRGTISASDTRIKKNIVDVDDAECLETLRLLKPKKYQYKDVIERGEEPVWGFIAQEVRDTLPYATELHRDVLPNIYELANVSQSNVITFTNFNTSNLESNVTTLIRTNGIDGQDHDIHLVEVIDEHTIRVEEDLSDWTGSVDAEGNVITQIETTTLTPEEYEALKDTSGYVANISGYQNANVPISVEEYNALEDTTGYEAIIENYTKTITIYPGTQLFVYGQEVDDFIFVKKEAIWTVATAALQEVDRQLQAEKEKTQQLEVRLSLLESTLASLIS